jgi:hypothetical protein
MVNTHAHTLPCSQICERAHSERQTDRQILSLSLSLSLRSLSLALALCLSLTHTASDKTRTSNYRYDKDSDRNRVSVHIRSTALDPPEVQKAPSPCLAQSLNLERCMLVLSCACRLSTVDDKPCTFPHSSESLLPYSLSIFAASATSPPPLPRCTIVVCATPSTILERTLLELPGRPRPLPWPVSLE